MQLIDLEDFRTKNESFEHFFLKQVARAYLFKQGTRCIATEVGVWAFDTPPFGTNKRVIDVLGIDIRKRPNDLAHKIWKEIDKEALAIGYTRGVAVISKNYRDEETLHWKDRYNIKNEREKLILETHIEQCYEDACVNRGYHKSTHTKLKYDYKNFYTLRGVEVKVSYSDFKNGFSMIGEYTYVIAPKGIIPVEELPQKVALLEFDFDKYEKCQNWEECLLLTKQPKKQYDSRFLVDKKNKKSFDYVSHMEYCKELLFTVAQQNTEETIFWNPWLKKIKEGYKSTDKDNIFNFKVGDRTPKGIVIDRRLKKNPKKRTSFHGFRHYNGYDEFYKLVVEDIGITDWISYDEIMDIV